MAAPQPNSILLIKGLNICGAEFYRDGLMKSELFSATSADVTELDYAYGEDRSAVPKINAALRARRHHSAIICDLSAFQDEFVQHFRDAIRHFVHAGGRVAFPTCEGLLLQSVLKDLFNVQWEGEAYGRIYWRAPDGSADNVDAKFPLQRLHSGKVKASELEYSAKACSYSNVPPHEACFGNTGEGHSVFPLLNFVHAAKPDDPDGMFKYSIATHDYGNGSIAYFGDVNAEPATCDLVAAYCLADVEGSGNAGDRSSRKDAEKKAPRDEQAKAASGEAEAGSTDDRRVVNPGMGPCMACGKADAKRVCGKCRQAGITVHYCNRECQRANWRLHKKHCGTTAAGPREADVASSQGPTATFNMAAVLQGLSQSEGGSSGLHTLLTNRMWWEGLSDERQRERFCMSYQLRNEDAYVFRAEMLGPYNTEDPPSVVHADFREYHGMALRKGMLPDSCKGDFVNSLYAKEHCMYAIEKSDIVERFGYASNEHMVLRSMAEEITGQSTMGW